MVRVYFGLSNMNDQFHRKMQKYTCASCVEGYIRNVLLNQERRAVEARVKRVCELGARNGLG